MSNTQRFPSQADITSEQIILSPPSSARPTAQPQAHAAREGKNEKRGDRLGDLPVSAFSSREALLGIHGNDCDELAVLDELHLAVLKGEKREVATASDIRAWMDLGAALTHDDRTGLEELAVIGLDAEVLRV